MPIRIMIGSLLGICFAFAWALAGLQGLPYKWRGDAFVIICLISLSLAVAVIRKFRQGRFRSARGTFNGTLYGFVVLLEAGSIVAAVIVLRSQRLGDYIMPTIVLIVGLHFYCLAHSMRGSSSGTFLWVSRFMSLIAISVIFLLAVSWLSNSQSLVIAGFGSAAVLWIAVLDALRESVRPTRIGPS